MRTDGGRLTFWANRFGDSCATSIAIKKQPTLNRNRNCRHISSPPYIECPSHPGQVCWDGTSSLSMLVGCSRHRFSIFSEPNYLALSGFLLAMCQKCANRTENMLRNRVVPQCTCRERQIKICPHMRPRVPGIAFLFPFPLRPPEGRVTVRRGLLGLVNSVQNADSITPSSGLPSDRRPSATFSPTRQVPR